MNADGIWFSFFDTGDPFCYLLAKRLEEQERRDDAEKPKKAREGEGDTPRPLD